MESDSFNHKISAGQMLKNGRWTCNNFNKVKFSMENHTLSTYLGIKLIEIGTDDIYRINVECQYQSLCLVCEGINKFLF